MAGYELATPHLCIYSDGKDCHLGRRCLCQLQPYSHWVGIQGEDAERGRGNRFAVEPNLSKNEPRSHLIYAKKKHLEKLSEYPFSSQEWDQNSPPWMVTVAPVAEVGGRRSMSGA